MTDIQNYVNAIYKKEIVTVAEWEELSKEIMPNEQITANNDEGFASLGQDDLGDDPAGGALVKV